MKFQHWKHKYTYRTDFPSPYRLININPQKVEFLLAPRFQNRRPSHGTYIESGSWDKRYTDEKLVWANNYEDKFQIPHLVTFNNYVFYRSVDNHFNKGVKWDQTEIYHWFIENLEEKSVSRYNTEENIIERLKWIDDLYNSIKKDGYKKQSELRNPEVLSKPPEYNEVRVNIGRNGEIIFDDGRHRFVIAKILNLDTIPVRVFVRHEEWQKLRSKVATAKKPDELSAEAIEYLDHPDMQDVASFNG